MSSFEMEVCALVVALDWCKETTGSVMYSARGVNKVGTVIVVDPSLVTFEAAKALLRRTIIDSTPSTSA